MNIKNDMVMIGVDGETFKKISKIAEKKQKSAPEELSDVLKKHIDVEDAKDNAINEGKRYLTEDR